jgi:SAM-dependent methyltransferase
MWDERFSRPGYAYGTAPNDFLAERAGEIPAGRVLSLAEGEGRNAVYLAGLGYDVVCVDSSAVGLEKARRLAAERGLEIETIHADLGNADEFEIEAASWEGIVSIFCHLPIELRQRIHRRIVAGLRPGGILILEAYTPRQLEYGTGGPPTLERLMTLDDLGRELSGLEIFHGQELEREIHEGTLHHGLGHVVQVVARKG